MLANTSLLALRSSVFERGRLYTQFSTLSTIEKFSFMRPCSASASWESSRQKISEIEAKPIKWHHFPRAHFFFVPKTISARIFRPDVSAKVSSSGCQAQNHQYLTTSTFPSVRGERGDVVG